jgi:hypothetical protein
VISDGNFYNADQLLYDGSGDLLVSNDNFPVGWPRHLSYAFWVGDGIAASPRGTIHADASPFPGLAFYCIVELTPSGTAKALFKS